MSKVPHGHGYAGSGLGRGCREREGHLMVEAAFAVAWVTLGHSLEARLDPVIARKSRVVIWWRGRQGDGGVGDVGSLDAAAAGVVGGFYGDGGCGAWCESGRMHGASWVLFV